MKLNSRLVPFIKPNFPNVEDVSQDYASILESNHFTNFGPYERKLSLGLAQFVGNNVSVSCVNNATSGLVLAIQAVCGLGDGSKKILMPSFTFAAGPEAAIWTRYEPLFIDIDSSSLQPSIKQAEEYLELKSESVAAILFCNIFGVGTKNIKEWEGLSRKYNIPLIIDSAAGFGSTYDKAERLGSRGVCEVFSFHATKPFAVGEGGAVVSRDKNIIDAINKLQNFGFGENRAAESVGMNAKLQEINAAIGLRQLEDFEKRLLGRQAVLEKYKTNLNPLGLKSHQNAENSSVCFATFIAENKATTDNLYATLNDNGVQAKRYYNPPLHTHPAFKDFVSPMSLEVTNNICEKVISLPVHDNMDVEDSDYVLSIIKSVC